MAQVRAIRSVEDYDAALARIAELMDALSGPEGQMEEINDPNRVALDVLTDLVELYEERHHPIGFPDPISAIMFRMDQANLTPRGPRALHRKSGQGFGGAFGKAGHHHVHSPGTPPTPGNTSRRPFAGTGSQLARTHCQVLSTPDFPSALWPRQVGFLTPKA